VLRVLLAEAELELIPESAWNHAAVRKACKAVARRAGDTILDQNLHQQAIRQLPEGERRGRPDIIHYTLLGLLESPLAKSGGLEVAIHTRGGELIFLKPDTRLPRGETRFHGLMAKVLLTGKSQDKDPLVWVEGKCSPAEALEKFARGPVLRLDEGGEMLDSTSLAEHAAHDKLTLVLGAFPAGDFSAAWKAAAPTTASVYSEKLNAWAVAAECVAWWRQSAKPAE
jgi:rRNA small subunit pseudouridine methyltransferase Nep1